MHRRIGAAMAALTLLLLLGASPAAAAVTPQDYSACTDELIAHYNDGISLDLGATGSVVVTGIKGAINPSGSYSPGSDHFRPCEVNQSLLNHDGVSAWIAIQGIGTSSGIIQMGVVNCNDAHYSFCASATGTFHAFWMTVGCGQTTNWGDFGVINDQQHSYEISLHNFGNGNLHSFYLDGVYKGSIYDNDARISCFINDTDNQWAAETEMWDGGDSNGSKINGNQATIFTNLRNTQTNGISGWQPMNWDPDWPCTPAPEDSDQLNYQCNRTTYDNNNSFEVWSSRW